MKLRTIVLVSALAIVVAPGAWAEDAMPGQMDQSAHVAELLDIFNQGCLHAYPAGSLTGYAASLAGEKLSREEFVRRTHIEEKSGEGWSVTGKSGNYVILASQGYEDVARPVVAGMGNNETCTVIATGPAGMKLLEPYKALKAQVCRRSGSHPGARHRHPDTRPAGYGARFDGSAVRQGTFRSL